MKKLFLFAVLTTLVGLAEAQQTTVRAPENTSVLQGDETQRALPSLFQPRPTGRENTAPTNRVIVDQLTTQLLQRSSLFEVGKMANIYGMMAETQSQITYDPRNNRVAVIFRGNDRASVGESDGNTLYIRYSDDGGQSWSAIGDNVSSTNQPRYPTISCVPKSDGSTTFASLWGQISQNGDGTLAWRVHGVSNQRNNMNPLYAQFPAPPPSWDLPYTSVLDQSTGDLYTMALAVDPANGASTGEFYFFKSTDGGASWAADLSTPCWSADIVPDGFFASQLRFDISPDGSTFVVAFQLAFEYEPDQALQVDDRHEIAWRVSTDKGRTWGDLQRIKPSEIPNTPQPLNADCKMSVDFDMIVSKENKPHFLTILSSDFNPFGLDRPTDTTIALNSGDSTFACEVVEMEQGWRIIPIGPARRIRINRVAFTSASSSAEPYRIHCEPKWARTWAGDKLFAKWISPFYSWRVSVVAGTPTLFQDTLAQVYVNGRHVDSRGIHPYHHPWNFADASANTLEMDSVMRYTGDFLSLFEEDATFGAKFTKIAKYASVDGQCFVLTPEFGVGERRDDDAVFSDQTVWFVQNLRVPVILDVELLDPTPGSFHLAQNYPNPFNPSTKIHFTLSSAGQTTLRVFNLLGQQVATLVDAQLTAGTHTVNFDTRSLPGGVYIYRLESGNRSMAQKMMLSK
ncbi:MAG: T9SS type A sorting domain-containing protein [Bacteroidia bacterium]|nr:T9SS type A sorting domain-containing protein [Bacteroidia bacterium]